MSAEIDPVYFTNHINRYLRPSDDPIGEASVHGLSLASDIQIGTTGAALKIFKLDSTGNLTTSNSFTFNGSGGVDLNLVTVAGTLSVQSGNGLVVNSKSGITVTSSNAQSVFLRLQRPSNNKDAYIYLTPYYTTSLSSTNPEFRVGLASGTTGISIYKYDGSSSTRLVYIPADGSLNIQGATTISGNFSASGTSTQRGNADFLGNVGVSGNLGIKTSPSFPLHVSGTALIFKSGNSHISGVYASDGELIVSNTNVTGAYMGSFITLRSAYSGGTVATVAGIKGSIDVWANNGRGRLSLFTAADGAANQLYERITIDGYGKVGISTTSPASGLDVNNTAVFRSGTTVSGLLSLNTLVTTGIVNVNSIFVSGNTVITGTLSVTGTTTLRGNANTLGTLQVASDTTVTGNLSVTGTSILRGIATALSNVLVSGSVGIGTSSPRNNIEIGNTTSNQTLRLGGIYRGTGTYTGLDQETTRHQIVFSSWRDVQTDTIGAKIVAVNKTAYSSSPWDLVQNTDIAFFTLTGSAGTTDSTTERMRLTASGNLGIGTSSPAVKIHIQNGTTPSSILFNNTDGILITTNSGSYIRLATSTSTPTAANAPGLVLVSSRGTNDSPTSSQSGDILGRVLVQGITTGVVRQESSQIIFSVDGAPTGGSVPGAIGFYTAAPNANTVERMRISASGNVGIGTTSPETALDVSGGSARIRNTVLGYASNGVNPASDTYRKIATLPASSSGTYDHILLTVVADDNYQSNGKSYYTIFLGNRNTFTYLWHSLGNIRSNAGIKAYLESDGSVTIWTYHKASAFTTLTYNIEHGQQITTFPNPTTGTSAGTLVFDTTNPTTYVPNSTQLNNGNFGIGTSSPASGLDVNDNAMFRSGVTVSGILSLGSLNVSGAATVTGAFNVSGATNLNTLNVSGAATVTGAFNVSGAANLNTLNVSGAATVTGAFNVSGATNLNTLNVSGAATVTGAFNVSGAANFKSGVTISGSTDQIGKFYSTQNKVQIGSYTENAPGYGLEVTTGAWFGFKPISIDSSVGSVENRATLVQRDDLIVSGSSLSTISGGSINATGGQLSSSSLTANSFVASWLNGSPTDYSGAILSVKLKNSTTNSYVYTTGVAVSLDVITGGNGSSFVNIGIASQGIGLSTNGSYFAGNGVFTGISFFADSPSATLRNPLTTGSILSYGLYINPQKVGVVSGGYGIYQAGANDTNVFLGSLQVSGATTLGAFLATGSVTLRSGLTVSGTTTLERSLTLYDIVSGVHYANTSHGISYNLDQITYYNGSETITGRTVLKLSASNSVSWAQTPTNIANNLFKTGISVDLPCESGNWNQAMSIGVSSKSLGDSTINSRLAGFSTLSGISFLAKSPSATQKSGTSPSNSILAYGLYIEPQEVGVVSGGYGIWQSGPSDLNYFAGKIDANIVTLPTGGLWIGSSSFEVPGGYPNNRLFVNGGAVFRSGVTVSGNIGVSGTLSLNSGSLSYPRALLSSASVQKYYSSATPETVLTDGTNTVEAEITAPIGTRVRALFQGVINASGGTITWKIKTGSGFTTEVISNYLYSPINPSLTIPVTLIGYHTTNLATTTYRVYISNTQGGFAQGKLWLEEY